MLEWRFKENIYVRNDVYVFEYKKWYWDWRVAAETQKKKKQGKWQYLKCKIGTKLEKEYKKFKDEYYYLPSQ